MMQHHLSIHLGSYACEPAHVEHVIILSIFSTCHTWVDTKKMDRFGPRALRDRLSHYSSSLLQKRPTNFVLKLFFQHVPQLVLLCQVQLQLQPQLDAQLKLFMHINFHSSAMLPRGHSLTDSVSGSGSYSPGCPFEWQLRQKSACNIKQNIKKILFF